MTPQTRARSAAGMFSVELREAMERRDDMCSYRLIHGPSRTQNDSAWLPRHSLVPLSLVALASDAYF